MKRNRKMQIPKKALNRFRKTWKEYSKFIIRGKVSLELPEFQTFVRAKEVMKSLKDSRICCTKMEFGTNGSIMIHTDLR